MRKINMLNVKDEIETVIFETIKGVQYTTYITSKYVKVNILQGLEIIKTEYKTFDEVPVKWLETRLNF